MLGDTDLLGRGLDALGTPSLDKGFELSDLDLGGGDGLLLTLEGHAELAVQGVDGVHGVLLMVGAALLPLMYNSIVAPSCQ